MSNDWITYDDQNVALGPMRREYIDLLIPWANNPVATRGVMMVPPMTLEQELRWYESIGKDPTNVIFAILLKENGTYRYIGHTGIHHITWPDGRGSTGTFIGDVSTHGKGIGTEAKLWLLHHAFHTLGLRKVTSEVKAFNGNSFGHLLKCGYKVIGTRKEQHFYEGHFVDEILFEVFRADFEPIWEAYKNIGQLPALSSKQEKLMKKLMN